MTRREEIKAKADELGQFYFPDECNVWARANIEAQYVSSACTEMAEWMQETMIEKACKWLQEEVLNAYKGIVWEQIVEDFCKAMGK